MRRAVEYLVFALGLAWHAPQLVVWLILARMEQPMSAENRTRAAIIALWLAIAAYIAIGFTI